MVNLKNHLFGFEWGPMNVARIMTCRGRRVVGVKTHKHDIEICVSPKGNNVQIYHNGERIL